MKHLCQSCDYYSQQGEVEKPGEAKSAIDVLGPNGHAQPSQKIGIGFCKLNPPYMVTTMEQSALDPRMAAQKRGREWPTVAADDFCAQHPARRIDQARAEANAIRADMKFQEGAPYNPTRFPDGAGFERPPTLNEAKAVATVAQGETLTERKP